MRIPLRTARGAMGGRGAEVVFGVSRGCGGGLEAFDFADEDGVGF